MDFKRPALDDREQAFVKVCVLRVHRWDDYRTLFLAAKVALQDRGRLVEPERDNVDDESQVPKDE